MLSELLIYAVLLAAVAVVWSVVLVDSGMLLEGVQRWLRGYHKRRWVKWIVGKEKFDANDIVDIERAYHQSTGQLDDQWWFKMSWGCQYCVAGQLALWSYLVWQWPGAWGLCLSGWLSFLAHGLIFISVAILMAGVWARIYRWSQR